MDEQLASQKIKEKLSDRCWRLNNLYYIKDKTGKKVIFRMNYAQKQYYNNMHYFNVILKARQLGFTTLSMIYYLDACLFNSNHAAGVIAHTMNDAQDLFENKIKFAYDNLPDWFKELRPAISDSARKLSFNNGSVIYTGTSLRSGTLQKLLISEYGKISAKYPEKAKEIRTGALNTVEQGQQITVESTAEGKSGAFYELYDVARKNTDAGVDLTPLDPKGFFFAWWKNPEYRMDADVSISSDLNKYFEEIELKGVTLTKQQKNWYAVKQKTQGEDMTQEYPSTPEEAFQGTMQGAFYTKEMRELRQKKQICHVPYNPKYEVYTWWDLGMNDLMSIWFYQYIDGRHCFIDYHESQLEAWSYYSRMLKDKEYNYAEHNFPHDGKKRIRGEEEIFTDIQLAQKAGINPIKVTPRTTNVYKDIMNHCIPVLPLCYFDENKCAQGIVHLDNYKRKWDKADSMWMKEALHDEASHGADSFRTFAVNADNFGRVKRNDPFKQNYTRSASWMG